MAGLQGDEIRVAVAAPPTDGRANSALERFLAKALGLRPRDVSVVSGRASRSKTVSVEGLDAAAARARLLGAAPADGPPAASGRAGKTAPAPAAKAEGRPRGKGRGPSGRK